MKFSHVSAAVVLASLLSGCPGDKPEAASPAAGSKAARSGAGLLSRRAVPRSKVGILSSLTLEEKSFSDSYVEGELFSIALNGTFSNPGGAAAYLQVSDDSGNFTTGAPVRVSKFDAYRISVPVKPALTVGVHTGLLSIRACEDANCTQPLADTLTSAPYTVEVLPLADWGQTQRNARHDGYVPVSIDPARFSRVWQWPVAPATVSGLKPPVAWGDKVFVAANDGSGAGVLALRLSDGVPVWRYQFTSQYGGSPYYTAPTVADGVVYAVTAGHSDSFLHALKLANGIAMYKSSFSTQWGEPFPPTVHAGRAYVNAGYSGGVVFAYGTKDGASLWNIASGTYQYNSPAVDDQYVYSHDGNTLRMIDPATGAVASYIGSNAADNFGGYGAVPMLGSADHVVAFNGAGYFSVPAARQLVGYSVQAGEALWMSINTYKALPATADGIVYAASSTARTLDAIDEATGTMLWSWTPPETSPVFNYNVLVTQKQVFVSTQQAVYAVDRRTHKLVWRASTPGWLALTSKRVLLVAQTDAGYDSTQRITAYAML